MKLETLRKESTVQSFAARAIACRVLAKEGGCGCAAGEASMLRPRREHSRIKARRRTMVATDSEIRCKVEDFST
jgi:hypothetical protein